MVRDLPQMARGRFTVTKGRGVSLTLRHYSPHPCTSYLIGDSHGDVRAGIHSVGRLRLVGDERRAGGRYCVVVAGGSSSAVHSRKIRLYNYISGVFLKPRTLQAALSFSTSHESIPYEAGTQIFRH